MSPPTAVTIRSVFFGSTWCEKRRLSTAVSSRRREKKRSRRRCILAVCILFALGGCCGRGQRVAFREMYSSRASAEGLLIGRCCFRYSSMLPGLPRWQRRGVHTCTGRTPYFLRCAHVPAAGGRFRIIDIKLRYLAVKFELLSFCTCGWLCFASGRCCIFYCWLSDVTGHERPPAASRAWDQR